VEEKKPEKVEHKTEEKPVKQEEPKREPDKKTQELKANLFGESDSDIFK